LIHILAPIDGKVGVSIQDIVKTFYVKQIFVRGEINLLKGILNTESHVTEAQIDLISKDNPIVSFLIDSDSKK
jgi:hypothetical protein